MIYELVLIRNLLKKKKFPETFIIIIVTIWVGFNIFIIFWNYCVEWYGFVQVFGFRFEGEAIRSDVFWGAAFDNLFIISHRSYWLKDETA